MFRTQNLSKYKAKKTVIDGITFASKKEAKRYEELKLLEKAGTILNLELQKRFLLQEGFKKNQQTYRPIYYYADFFYMDKKTQRNVVEDVKASKNFKTDIYKIKKKLFEFKYKDLTISEVI